MRSIPGNFLLRTDTLTKINAVVGELEGSYKLQNDIDFAYGKLCNIINGEMFEKLNHRKINISDGSSNKRRRVGNHGGTKNCQCYGTKFV